MNQYVIEGFHIFMGNTGGIVAAIVGVVLAGLTVVTAVNVSQDARGDASEVSDEDLIDYDRPALNG